MQYHRQLLTRDRSQDPNRVPCPQCPRTYKTKLALTAHLKYECGKEPQFRCPYCPHRTHHKGQLQVHIKRKHRDILQVIPNLPVSYQHQNSLSPAASGQILGVDNLKAFQLFQSLAAEMLPASTLSEEAKSNNSSTSSGHYPLDQAESSSQKFSDIPNSNRSVNQDISGFANAIQKKFNWP